MYTRTLSAAIGLRQAPRQGGIVAALVAVALVVAGCGGGSDADRASAESATSAPAPSADGNPVGVIAIGHSGLTGEGSDPSDPGKVLENSWATGTSLEVNSIDQRLVAVRPETDGHVVNTAQGGAPAASLAAQALRALAAVPAPALVIVQTIDNDIRCNGTDGQHVTEFGVALADALEVVTTASPDSRILMVGQFGRPTAAGAEKLVAEVPYVQAGLTG